VSGQAYNRQGDIVVAALTSHAARFSSDYALVEWKVAGLHFPSTVRMLLTTFADSQVIHYIGRLTDRDWAEVQKRVTQVFTWP